MLSMRVKCEAFAEKMNFLLYLFRVFFNLSKMKHLACSFPVNWNSHAFLMEATASLYPLPVF